MSINTEVYIYADRDIYLNLCDIYAEACIMKKCGFPFFFLLLLYTYVIFIGFVVHEIFLYYCLLVLQTNIKKKINVSIK